MGSSEKIAVLGAGLMGHGIALLFAGAGHEVALFDPDPDALTSAPARMRAGLQQIGLPPGAADAVRLHDTLPAAVRQVDLVVEAAPEDLELKRSLFARTAEAADPATILATNTSVIRIGEIAESSPDPGQLVGAHFWNPPHLIPLVEVIQTPHTRPEVVQRLMDLLLRAGKQPVRVRRDLPGGVGNRLQHALWREAVALVDAGVVEPADLDQIVKSSFGMRLPVLGPIENADLVGLDLTLAIHEYLLPHIDRRPAPAPLLRELVARGDLGVKTGQGFRRWTPETVQSTRLRLAEHLAAAAAPGRQPDDPNRSSADSERSSTREETS
jgi:3-hydroxybutyryl-CoA dehydrogenase